MAISILVREEVMVLPDQPGATPRLAVAGEKSERCLMNEDNLGIFAPGK